MRSPYPMYMWTSSRDLVGWEIVLTFGILGIVEKSPSIGGGEPPMSRLPFLTAVMMEE